MRLSVCHECLCVRGWKGEYVFLRRGFFDKTVHALLNPLENMLERCQMPIRERSRRTEPAKSFEAKDATAAILVYYKFRFYGISKIPVYILHSFIRLFLVLLRFLLSLLLLPVLSCTFYCSKCTVNHIQKWVNRC